MSGSDTPYAYLDALLPPWIAPYIKAASLLGVPPEVAYPAAVFVVGIVVGASAALAIVKWRAGRNERAQAEREQRSSLIHAVMAVREELLGYGAVNAGRVEAELGILENSRHSLWIAPKAWAARSDFIDCARAALNVRRTRNDYRNEIEREQTGLMLDDAGGRVRAALRSKVIPPAFDPYEDEPDTWLRRIWCRMWRLQRLWRRIKRRWRDMRGK